MGRRMRCLYVSVLLLVSSPLLRGQAFAGALTAMSAGGIVGMAMPTYGEYNKIAKAQSEPGFPAMMLVTGGHATFIRKNFVTGGEVLVGSTKSQSGTSGSYYSTSMMGFFAGYGAPMGMAEILGTVLLGFGTTSFSTGSSSQGSVVETTYLAAQPEIYLGFRLSQSFKVSLGGGYQYGLPYRVAQYGKEALDNPSKATVGGVLGIIQVSFGFFN